MTRPRKASVERVDALAIAVVFTATLFLFGPVSAFAANRDEFGLGLPDLLRLALPIAALTAGVIFGVLAILRGTAWAAVASVILAGSSLFYLQSNFLVWDYGLFDGSAIAWDRLWVHGVAELFVWSVVLVAALRFRTAVCTHARSICAFLLIAQALSLVGHSLSVEGLWRSKSASRSDPSLFQFSKQRNVVFLVLDAFQTSSFETLLEREPALREALDGFVFFPENTAAFSTTAMSIPAMLTGEMYRNQEPRKEFLSRVLGERSLGTVLSTAGYQTHHLSLGRYCEHLPNQGCRSLRSFEAADRRGLERTDASQLFELVLFRNLPHFAKRAVFDEGPGWSARLFGSTSSLPVMQRSTLSIASTLRREADALASKPTFKFIHYFLPHKPIRLDARCEALDEDTDTPEGYLAQARCALELVLDLTETLRAIDVHDETIVVIASDHGLGGRKEYQSVERFFASVDRALPLLLIKPLAARGALEISSNPTQSSDLPATIAEAADVAFDFAGVSAFRAREPRVRSYMHYVWQHRYWDDAYLPPLREFLIEGSVRDPASWRMAADPLAPVVRGR